jgi:hypothetical protein
MITDEVINGALWRKARRSVGNGACVEIALVTDTVMVRDSMNRIGPVLRYSARAWDAFVANTKTGTLDVAR